MKQLAKTFLILFIFILSGCEKTEIIDNLEVYDNLIYHDTRVEFSDGYVNYEYNPVAILTIYTTVTIPNNINIKNYGFCWYLSKNFITSPLLSDNATSLGATNSKKFNITVIFDNEPYMFYGELYIRAYVVTDDGVVYGRTYHW